MGILDQIRAFESSSPKLMAYLQSPQFRGLGQGILSATQTPDSKGRYGSFAEGMNQGFKLGDTYADLDRKRKQEEARLELATKYFGLDTSKFDFDKEKFGKTFGLDSSRFDFDKEKFGKTHDLNSMIHGSDADYKRAQIEDLLRKAEKDRQQQEFFQSLLSGSNGGGGGAGGGLLGNLSDQNRQRAGLAGMLGGMGKATDILTEIDPTSVASPTTITNNQASIQAVDELVPDIKELVSLAKKGELPNNKDFGLIKNAKQKNYDALIGRLTDKYIQANKLPRSNESIKLVKEIFDRGTFESEADYAKRLEGEIKKLQKSKDISTQITPQLYKKSPSEMTAAEIEAELGGYNE